MEATTLVNPFWWAAMASMYPSTMTAQPLRRTSSRARSSR